MRSHNEASGLVQSAVQIGSTSSSGHARAIKIKRETGRLLQTPHIGSTSCHRPSEKLFAQKEEKQLGIMQNTEMHEVSEAAATLPVLSS